MAPRAFDLAAREDLSDHGVKESTDERAASMAFQGGIFCAGGLVWARGHQAHAQALLPTQAGTTSSVGLGYLPQTNLMGSSPGQSGMTLLPIPMT